MDRVGRFRIERCLGHGGMGEVYLAEDEHLGRKVALKTVPPWMAASAAHRETLAREARLAAGLNHPSIAQVHDLIADGDDLFLVMEYVEGRTLAELLREGEPLGAERLLRIAVDIAEGLTAAHERGIIHRDLKAENVAIDTHGRAKILDFGLAAPAADVADGSSGGTLNAMSPEQVERRALDHRSDLFALGTLLYELATGTHPFRAAVPLQTMHNICHTQPPPVAGAPPAAARLISQLLAKDPERRPQRTREVATTLRQALRAEERSAAAGAETRRRGRVWLVAVALLAVAAAWLGLREPHAEPVIDVAILAPEVAADDRLALAAAGVRIAAVRTLAGLEGVYPINPQEVDALEGDARAVATAVAADELLSARISATASGCRVELTRLAADGHALWMDQLELPLDDMRLIADAVAASVRSCYPNRGLHGDTVAIPASPEDYRAYLRLHAIVADPPDDVSWDWVLDELEQIRAGSPKLIDAYSLASSVARYQYETTHNPAYLDEAERIVRDLLAFAPDHPRALLAATDVALAVGELERAERHLERMRAVDPDSQLALSYRAELAERRGEVDQALALMRSAVERRRSWWYLLLLAHMEHRLGDLPSTRAHLDEANRLAPDNLLVMSKLAHLEMYRAPARAEELYLALVARSPQPQHLNGLGTVQLLLGDYRGALVSFRRAVERGSQAPETRLNVADCHALLGERDEANRWYLATLEAVARGDSEPAGHLGIKAQALAQLGRHDEAATAVARALELAPDSAQASYDAALVAALRGDAPSAQRHAQKALELGMDPRWLALPWFEAAGVTVAQPQS